MLLRRGEPAACADAFWEHWAGVRGYYPSPQGATSGAAESAGERHRRGLLRGDEGAATPEGFGDGWAWDPWDAGDMKAAAGAVKAAADCFLELGRLVRIDTSENA